MTPDKTPFQLGLRSIFGLVLLAALVARLIPAIEAAREIARRTPCNNNVVQFVGPYRHCDIDAAMAAMEAWRAKEAASPPAAAP
jgi:hypothetical protein